MVYILENSTLKVSISDVGAELISAVHKHSGCEYIWQRNEEYWASSAPVLFPVCGRIYGGYYTYAEKKYEMGIHGFARHSKFEATDISDCSVTLRLRSDEQTKKVYPFDFILDITYTLDKATLTSSAVISNPSDTQVLPAAFGAHPGFNVPLTPGGKFEDYYLRFSEECSPDRLVLSDTCFDTGRREALTLEDGRTIRLSHRLFDNDAIFMSHAASSVTLMSDSDKRSVTLEYGDMPYLGLWHTTRSDAPFLCIEPWYGLPSYDGTTDDLAKKSDMFRIVPGSAKTVTYKITFN